MNPLRPLPTCALALHAAMALALGTAAGTAQAAKAKAPLNDTGMALCVVDGVFTKECTGSGQDGEFGRDATKASNTDGSKGFAFAKVCNSGELAGTGTCPADPALGSGANKWGCTQDKVTKLIWEVKVKDGGLRDWLKAYTNWGDGRTGDSSEFVAQVNAHGLCGASDWKLPTVEQLQSLVHLGVAFPGPTIDKNWFPNTTGDSNSPSHGDYWTANGYAGGAYNNAWAVRFNYGFVHYVPYGLQYSVRLVRAGQ